MPEGLGSQQWQGQFPIATTLTAGKAKKYNVYCVIEADNDASGVTVKLTDAVDDNNFFFANRCDVTADKPCIFKAESVSLPVGDAGALSLFFDFGGTPEGTRVKISKIYIEEAISYDGENNLWKTVDRRK